MQTAAPNAWPAVSVVLRDSARGVTTVIGNATARNEQLLDTSLGLYIRKCQAYLRDKESAIDEGSGLPEVLFEVALRNVTGWSDLLRSIEGHIVKVTLERCMDFQDVATTLERLPHLKEIGIKGGSECIDHFLTVFTGGDDEFPTPGTGGGGFARRLSLGRRRSSMGKGGGGSRATPYGLPGAIDLRELTLEDCTLHQLGLVAQSPLLRDNLVGLHVLGMPHPSVELDLGMFPILSEFSLGAKAGQLSSVDVSGSGSLTHLDFTPNEGSATAVVHDLPSLTLLTLSSVLRDITLRDCPRLSRMALQDVPPPLQHVTLERLPCFAPFNLSGCPTLESMALLGAMRLDDLKLQHCPKLAKLRLGGPDSNIKAVAVTNCPLLTSLSLQVTSGSAAAAGAPPCCPKLTKLTVASCPKLEAISLPPAAPCLASVTLQQLPALKQLPPLSNCSALKDLAVADAASIAAVRVVGCPQLREVTVWRCRAVKELGLGKMPAIQMVAAADCYSLTSVTLSDCGPLAALALAAVPALGSLTVSGCAKLQGLDLRGLGLPGEPSRQLSVLKVYNCASLEKVLLPSPLPALDTVEFINVQRLQLPNLAACVTLRELAIGGCRSLNNLELRDNHCLRRLDLRANPSLASLGLTSCPALESLDLSGNPAVQTLKVETCGALQRITVGDTPSLKTMQLRGCGALKRLDLAHSKENKPAGGLSLAKLQIASCHGLESIRLPAPAPHLQVVRLTDLPALVEGPNLDGCGRLVDVTAHRLAALPRLCITNCPGLAVVDIRNCPKMSELDLTGASNLQVDEGFDLDAVQGLTKVVLKGCSRMRQVPLMVWQQAPKLSHLDVSGCPLLEKLNWRPTGTAPLYNPDDLDLVEEPITEVPTTTRTPEAKAHAKAKAEKAKAKARARAKAGEKPREPWRDIQVVLDPGAFDRLDEYGMLRPPPPEVQARSLEEWLEAQLGLPGVEFEGRVFGVHGDAWAAMTSDEKMRITAMLDRAGFKHQSEKEQLEYAARCTAKTFSRSGSRSGSIAGSANGSRANSQPGSRSASRPGSKPGSRSVSQSNSRAASPTRKKGGLAQAMSDDSDDDSEDDDLSNASGSDSEAGDGAARKVGGSAVPAVRKKPPSKPVHPPVLFKHHMYGMGCHGPVPLSGQAGKRVAGTTELEEDMDSCGAACRGARTADAYGVQLITRTEEPIVRPIKVTTRHHARMDACVTFPNLTLERRWGPFRAAAYPSSFTASANIGICRHGEHSICILVPKLGVSVSMPGNAGDEAGRVGASGPDGGGGAVDRPLVPRSISLQVEPARRLAANGEDPLEMEVAAMKPMQSYVLQEVAAPAVKGAPTAELSVSSPRSVASPRGAKAPITHTRSSLLKAAAAAANSAANSPRKRDTDSPRGAAGVPRVANLVRKVRAEPPPPPSTNAQISAQLRLRAPIQTTPAAATYELALDGASSVAPTKWQGQFNALQLKAFETHSHWKPLFSSWEGGNWKKGVVKVRMVMQLQGCRMAYAQCPLLHKKTQQPLAFTSYLETARLHGRDATIVCGPVDLVFRF